MDFKSCFTDCCMECNSLCPNYRTSSKIQGQGDCKDSINFQEHQIDWEKGKNLGKKFREDNRFGFKEEQQKKQLSTYCDCFSKNNKNEDFLGKIRHETKYEKKNFEFFQNCTTPWNSSYANWSNNEINESSVFGDLESKQSDSEKLVGETISELKEKHSMNLMYSFLWVIYLNAVVLEIAEKFPHIDHKTKVEFLLRIFKNYNPKVFSECCNEISQGDYIGIIPKDIHHLYNINKRLGIAEKNIQRLTLVLENLLTNSNKRKALFATKNPIFSESLNFEEMPISQRINLLKNRNDFLFDFMKDFLQVRSVEGLYSMLDSMPNDYELNQNRRHSAYSFVEDNRKDNFNRENAMETIKELRGQVSTGEKDTSPSCTEYYPSKHVKKGENATKCFRNKLEVISEQAELAFYYENEYRNSKECRKKSSERLKEKLLLKEENEEKDLGISEKTAKLFAQEAMLKSSLDKAHFEIFSNRDSVESKKNSPNLSIETSSERHTGTSLGSLRSVLSESENTKKFKLKDVRKCPNHKEHKKEIKQERNNESRPSCLSKKSTINATNKTNKLLDNRNPSYKISSQKSPVLLSPPIRSKENGYYLPEMCSYLRGENKKEVKTKNKRPVSTPGSFDKGLHISETREPVREKNRKKISGINNVRNKNKILLSQKSCVQTA